MSEQTKGLPVPAMAPLHPDKPLRAIVAGETWTKRASQRMSDKRPTCLVMAVGLALVQFRLRGRAAIRHATLATFRRDWE